MAEGFAMVLWGLGVLGVGLWMLEVDGTMERRVLVLTVTFAVGLMAWRGVSRTPSGRILVWDGASWSLDGGSKAPVLYDAQVKVHLDFQFLMLVRLVQAGLPPVWLWLERRASPSDWLDLRRALHAPVSVIDPAISA